MTDEIFFAELSVRNERFWNGQIGPANLNRALESFGLVLEKCVLVKLLPDSGSTWIVRLLDQEGVFIEMDIDLEPVELLEKVVLKVPAKAKELREYAFAQRLSQLVRNAE
ncbi:MAG: hypothetical protein AB8G18_17260 [Gammaproteobacteria bacterium]